MYSKIITTFLFTLIVFFSQASLGTVHAANISVTGKARVLNIDNSYLDFSHTNANVSISDSTGIFSGYAWIDDTGWVAFGTENNADGPVSLNLTTGVVTGKAKVLNTGDFLYFSTNNSNVTVALATGVFSGYVWSTDAG